MEVTTKLYQSTLKVYIDGFLHLTIPKARFIALQSWIERPDWHVVEIYLEGQTITCEYTSLAKWQAILRALDEYLP